jgi:hypothetical protein
MKAILISAIIASLALPAHGQAEYMKCSTRNKTYEGTKTKIGEAWVTAGHLGAACGFEKSGNLDLSVISRGETGSCTDGAEGENVYLVGFPTPEGDVQRGVILSSKQEIDGQSFSVAAAKGVTFGYSGGPAISVNDGRVVGMIISVGKKSDNGFKPVVILPISTICENIN